MLILKFGLFALSTLGTFELIRRISKDKIDVYFLPSLTIAIQVTLLYFAGILNLLPEMTIALYVLGFAGLAFSIIKSKGIKFTKAYINAGYIALIIILLVMALSVRGKQFSVYDNFSHWALVVRNMLEVNHYPNFENTIITFQGYPLGSATYIYFFAKLINKVESVQMLAQIYMITAAVFPLFSFAKKKSKSIGLAMLFLVFINLIFVYNVNVGNLPVDTLLPVVGVCGLLFARKYCIEENGGLFFWLLSCYMVEIIQIKNSGIFFVIIIIAAIVKPVLHNSQRISNICSVLFPFLSLLIWQKHCKYVFSAAATTKHAMTADNYKSVFEAKTNEDIRAITSSLFRFVTTYKDVWALFGITVLLGCFIWFFCKPYWGDFKRTFVFSIVIYVAYQIGMLGMYVFSMPIGEALRLASKERYTKTIIIAILLIYMALAIRAVSEASMGKVCRAAATLGLATAICLFAFVSQGSVHIAAATISSDSRRTWVEDARDRYAVPMRKSYCMLIPNDDAGYAYHLQRYVFQSTDVSEKVVKSMDDLNNISAEYIFVYDSDNEFIQSWIRENYPEQSGNEVIIQGEKAK